VKREIWLAYWRDVAKCQLEEFLMWFDEHVKRRCGVCRRKNGSGHKMDCYREYTR
jgi:hypothetical protein